MNEFKLTDKDVNNVIKFNKARGQRVDLYPLTRGAVPSLAELDNPAKQTKEAPKLYYLYDFRRSYSL